MFAAKKIEDGSDEWSNYVAHMAPGVIGCKDGTLIAMFKVRPIDLQSSSNQELAQQRRAVNKALSHLGTGWAIYTTIIRDYSEDYTPPSETHFPTIFGYFIDHERRLRYENVGGPDKSRPYESSLVYSLTYTPARLSKQRLRNALIKTDSQETEIDEAILDFEEKIVQFIELMSARAYLKFERLGLIEKVIDGETIVFSEMAGFLKGQLYGNYDPVIVYDTGTIGVPELTDSIFTQDIDFGTEEVAIGNRLIKTVVVHGFPMSIPKQAMRALGNMAMPLSWTSRYVCLDNIDAKKIFGVYKGSFRQSRINPVKSFISRKWAEQERSLSAEDGVSMIQAATLGVENGDFTMGFYTTVITVRGNTPAEVDKRAKRVREVLARQDFSAQIEEVISVEVLMSTLPGNHLVALPRGLTKIGTEDSPKPMLERARQRQHYGTSVVAASLLPLTGHWAGEKTHPSPRYREAQKNPPPLLFCDTTGNTPARITTHLGDLGHTFVLGQTGSGKSTILNLLAVMQLKYKNGLVIVLDKDYSFYVTCQLMGGKYYDMSSTMEEAPKLAPMANVADPAEREWLGGWFGLMAELGGVTMTPDRQEQIKKMLELAAETGVRNISKCLNMASLDQDLMAALKQYTPSGGGVGKILDGEEDIVDEMKTSSMLCFEMGAYFKSVSFSQHTIPLAHYLFHMFERLFDGRPATIIVDEGHNLVRQQVSDDGKPRFDYGARLSQLLLEIRKLNAYMIFATQNLQAIANASPEARAALMQSTACRIYLADKNAKGDGESYDQYRKVGLSGHEIDIIAAARMPGEMLVTKRTQESKGGDDVPNRRLCAVGLSDILRETIGVTYKDDVVDIIKPLIEKHNGNPHGWLRDWWLLKGVIEKPEDYDAIMQTLITDLNEADMRAGITSDWGNEFLD